jgi:DNA-binding beta-propeller fold protein YncE
MWLDGSLAWGCRFGAIPWRILMVAVTVCAVALAGAASASAAVGDLTPAGCIADSGGPASCIGAGGLGSAGAIAVSPDGRNAYVASYSNAVVVFARNPTSGALTPTGCIGNTGNGPPSCSASADGLDAADAVAVSHDGHNVYVGSYLGKAVTVFSRNSATGALTPAGCIGNSGTGPPSCTGADGLNGVAAIAVSLDGNNVYVASRVSSAVVVFARNSATGALTPAGCIGNSGTGPPSCIGADGLAGAAAIAVSPDGHNVYVAAHDSGAVVVFARNPATGALTSAGCIGDTVNGPPSCNSADGLFGAAGIAVSPDGHNVYVASDLRRALVVLARNPASGALTPAGCIGNTGNGPPSCTGADGLNDSTGVAVSPDGRSVYVAAVDDAVVVFARNLTSGALTPAGCVGNSGTGPPSCIGADGLAGANAVTVSPDGLNAYVTAAESNAVVVFGRAVSTGGGGTGGGGGGGGGGGTGGGGGGGTGGGTTPGARIGSVTAGGRTFTLSASLSTGCLAASGRLQARLVSAATGKATATAPRFARVTFVIDRGIKHLHHHVVHSHGKRITRTTVTYSANDTASKLPATASLRLAGLSKGPHTLRVNLTFRQTVTRHRHHVIISVTMTLKARFRVC